MPKESTGVTKNHPRAAARLFTTCVVAMVAAMIFLCSPAGAQENAAERTAAEAGPLTDASVRMVGTDGSPSVNRAIIAAEDCDFGEAATITVEGRDSESVTLREGGNVNMTADEDRIVAQGRASDGTINGVRRSGFSDGTGTVVRTTGIKCVEDTRDIFRDNENEDRERGPLEIGEVAGADGLLDLECDEFLDRYRSLQGQYGDAAVTIANVNVQERFLVCLEEEVVKGTATDDDLPDTGGLPLVGLAALGLAAVAVGASVVRGAGRDR